MRAVSLFLVFVLAKAVLIGVSAAAPAYMWQDAMVALAFGFLGRAVYWALAIYTAINIPVERALFTPLTRPMVRAARGPLADSLLVYLTATNILLMVSIVAVASGLPWLLRRVAPQFARLAVACAIPVIIFGPMASSRTDTRGMDRNVITALIGAGLPRGGMRDWRGPGLALDGAAEDVSRYAGAAKGLNVVMISLESTAAQYLSLYGAGYETMPHLSALARRSVVFENAYAVYPESIKGLYSVLCSTYPAFDSRAEEYENTNCQSVASVLADAGYRTAMFHSGRFGYLGMESIIRSRGYQTLEDAGDIGGNRNSSFGVDEPATVARMLAWIDALPRGQRFFLTYLPIAGHHPYATPERGPFAGGDEIDQYRNALHYGDESLGALIEGLRARGLERNTLWVIYGDHGEAFHQHAGNYGHTFFLYEENVHVPFLIAAPGLMRGQERVRRVVSLVDTAPTILALMGIAPPKNYQGLSMLGGAPRRALFFADYSLGLLGLRDGPWKFVYEIGSGRTRLFDLERDPGEVTDVSGREAARVSRYGEVVRGWSRAQKTYVARAAVR